MIITLYINVLLATTVMFTETTYSVDEDGGSVVIGVELSNPSATAKENCA